MELHQLRYFCAVVETGSFSRAAEQSHVSQPSLSQQILKLADELGTRLFDRLGRSVRLTELGKTFLQGIEPEKYTDPAATILPSGWTATALA